MKISEKFMKWYRESNGPIAIMSPCKEAYIQGALEERYERIVLANKICNCLTIEEVRELLRIECDSLDKEE